ncbi:monovalent cation/H+ antiporter complex subunit F [Rariglobus hedericola]|uniref:Cation:proton antiporter n=1 Tax=Rariglobus hedericola TaxID=2597822 RepID=A0A556QP58_9BACT|nr:monovalent cation/H+ antiporter complex subunit F [Rariglobus hedericola]TSJ78382.1 hypothetical protein FPL22_03510 [Rariglobus hedericola]
MNLFLEIAYYLGWAVLLTVTLCGFWRVIAGPTTLDRMVGFDAVTIAVTALVAIFSIHAGTSEYMELIIVMTALGFFTTVAYCYYLSQPKQRSGEDFNQEDGK